LIEGTRPGPAIGLPTRTEQGDLDFILHASHGEFPRVVFAPATVDDCFNLMTQAFNIAERYQMPVLLITDHYMANSYFTADKFDLSKVTIDRGLLFDKIKPPAVRIKDMLMPNRAFRRGPSPATETLWWWQIPTSMMKPGILIEDAETRTKMMDKRFKKMDGLKKESSRRDIRRGQRRDVINRLGQHLRRDQRSAATMTQATGAFGHLHLSQIWPFPG